MGVIAYKKLNSHPRIKYVSGPDKNSKEEHSVATMYAEGHGTIHLIERLHLHAWDR